MENFYFAFVRYFSGINNYFSMYSFGKLNLYRIVKGNIAPGESELTYEMLTLTCLQVTGYIMNYSSWYTFSTLQSNIVCPVYCYPHVYLFNYPTSYIF